MSDVMKRMARVARRAPDLDRSVGWATEVMGMREVERLDGVSSLPHAACHHSLQSIAAE